MTDGTTTTPAAPAPATANTGGWNSLRMRFGVLLALALLPWLLFSALDAYRSATQTRQGVSERLDILASNTVSEVGLILRAGRFGLEAAPRLVAQRGCEAGGAELLARLGVYDALVVQDESGAVTCQVPGDLTALQVVGATPFTPENDFRVELGYFDAGEGVRDVVLLQNRIGETSEIYTLVLPTTLGLRAVVDGTLGSNAAIALTKPDGSAVLGRTSSPEETQRLRGLLKADEVTFLDLGGAGAGNPARRVASRGFEDLGVYITVGRDAQPGSRSLLSSGTEIFLPILVWLVGFSLIWLGTQTMLITPLARMRSVARRYADGRLDERVELSDSAAGEVRGLAQTFNRMAGQLEDRNARIADNLDEKDTLLREIHHRVKNNLQIIISLLNMQERKAQSAEAVAAIAETRARINAIAVVHRGLYESDDLRSIDVPTFVSRLLSSLGDSLGLEERGLRLKQSVDPCELTADSAIPVALFIVEAVGNAAEHGLSRGGIVSVTIAPEGPDTLVIEIADNGRGVGDPASMKGIGTRLMQGFARQLAAELTYHDNAPGLRARLVVPIDTPCDEPFRVRRRK